MLYEIMHILIYRLAFYYYFTFGQNNESLKSKNDSEQNVFSILLKLCSISVGINYDNLI